MDFEQARAIMETAPGWAVPLLVGLGAFAELLVPVLPGDTLVVAGAAMAGATARPVWGIVVAAVAGSVLGGVLDVALARVWLRRRRGEPIPGRRGVAVALVVDQFRRHGAVYLSVNRFVPGLRAFFFVAAGFAGLAWRPILLWSTLSSLLWYGVLVLGGDVASRLLLDGGRAAWIRAGIWVVVAGAIFYGIWRLRRARFAVAAPRTPVSPDAPTSPPAA